MPDDKYMWLALDLAEKGRGKTSPNPMVGAVLVKEGEIVGTGYHAYPGGPHAEVVAIESAREKAKGSTLFVNLEPCSHQGKTPPCVDKIIAAGVKKVVAAMVDPNPLVSGKGIEKLEKAGIKVKVGLLQSKAERLIEVFVKHITSGLPFVTFKTAMTLDGKIATKNGESRWITGEKAREQVHYLRNQVDGIITGINTVLKDDPSFTTRLKDENSQDATRIVVDSGAKIPLTAKIINQDSTAKTIIAVTSRASEERLKALREKGVEIINAPEKDGEVDLTWLLKRLAEKNLAHLLLECGGTLSYSMISLGLVDKAYFFIAPMIFGGKNSPTPVDGEGIDALNNSWKLKEINTKNYEQDLLVIGYFSKEG